MAWATLSRFLILMAAIGQFETAWIDACLGPGATAGRLLVEHRTCDPNADPQPSGTRHGADRKLDPRAPAGRGAAGQHRLRVPGGRRHHAHDRALFHAVREPADRAGAQRPGGDPPALAWLTPR